ncbi:MAG: site-2 protease family protein [Eubacteriales bacterium]|nr:site-2 protease family protein [Eubacteriales bacterium]
MTLRGIHIRVHPATIAALAVAFLLGDAINTLIALLLLALHESAHIAAAEGLGVRVAEVELLPFGGRIRTEGEAFQATKKEALIALAGPAANAVAALAIVAAGTVTDLSLPEAEYALQTSLLLALVNLLPAFPLDGGRVLYALVAARARPGRAERIVRTIGRCVAAAFALLSVAAAVCGIYNYTLWLMTGFLLAKAWRGPTHPAFGALRAFYAKDRLISTGEAVPVRHLVMRRDADGAEVLRALSANRYNLVTFVDEDGQTVETLWEKQLFGRILEERTETAADRNIEKNAEKGKIYDRKKTPGHGR